MSLLHVQLAASHHLTAAGNVERNHHSLPNVWESAKPESIEKVLTYRELWQLHKLNHCMWTVSRVKSSDKPLINQQGLLSNQPSFNYSSAILKMWVLDIKVNIIHSKYKGGPDADPYWTPFATIPANSVSSGKLKKQNTRRHK